MLLVALRLLFLAACFGSFYLFGHAINPVFPKYDWWQVSIGFVVAAFLSGATLQHRSNARERRKRNSEYE
jgi:hypothetical protein